MPKIGYDLIQLKGGWDTSTPTLALANGACRESLNFEASVAGGYTRIAGYERYSGQPSPTDAVYKTVFVSSFVNVPTVGQTLTGQTSGATGIVIAIGANYIAITKATGAFSTSENVKVGATLIGVSIVPTNAMGAQNHAIYLAAAADQYRSDIAAVPGSGAALGCVLHNDVLYAFRANAGGTAIDLYKSSAGGWVQVPFYNEISFTAGTTKPADGETLTQGGVTATIKRVCTQGGYDVVSGGWAAGQGVGRFIITTPVGGNFAAGAATATGGTTVTLSGVQTAITMAVGGKFEFSDGNFTGAASTNRKYGCDGINRAFEFDGDVLAPIVTGATTDNPKHIEYHKNILFVAIGSSLMYSTTGNPFNYQATLLAGEIGVGELITGLLVMPGSQATATMMVTSRANTFMLYGTGASSFQMVSFNTGAGGLDYTQQNMADTYMMDDRGVVSLKTSLNFGNFDQATLTFNINKFIGEKRTKTSYACLDRRKSQYRIFFNDGFGLYITMVNGQWLGNMPVYFPNPVYMVTETKYTNGEEASFFCSTNGFVYQLDKGTSFDGTNLDAYLVLNYNSIKSPRSRKRYRKCAVEVSGSGYAQIAFGYLLGYSASDISQDLPRTYSSNIQMMQWDNFTWDNFTWDGKTIVPNECQMDGTAENVALTFRSGTNYIQPYTINTAILHYSHRRAMR